MGQMSPIVKNLFVGREVDSIELAQMSTNRISHVVRVGDDPESTWKVPMSPQPTYFMVKAYDRPDYDMRIHVAGVNEFVHKARLDGGIVLIHCMAGVSRSVSLTTAYLMSVTNYGLFDVLRVIKAARRQANPNRGFLRQLEEFEKQGLSGERERIRAKFSLKEGDDPLGDNAFIKRQLEALGPPAGQG